MASPLWLLTLIVSCIAVATQASAAGTIEFNNQPNQSLGTLMVSGNNTLTANASRNNWGGMAAVSRSYISSATDVTYGVEFTPIQNGQSFIEMVVCLDPSSTPMSSHPFTPKLQNCLYVDKTLAYWVYGSGTSATNSHYTGSAVGLPCQIRFNTGGTMEFVRDGEVIRSGAWTTPTFPLYVHVSLYKINTSVSIHWLTREQSPSPSPTPSPFPSSTTSSPTPSPTPISSGSGSSGSSAGSSSSGSGSGLKTCLDVKKEYQKQNCCGMPTKAFDWTVSGSKQRRLSKSDLVDAVLATLEEAKMQGGAEHAASMATQLIDMVQKFAADEA